jgi:hypothetical protein
MYASRKLRGDRIISPRRGSPIDALKSPPLGVVAGSLRTCKRTSTTCDDNAT